MKKSAIALLAGAFCHIDVAAERDGNTFIYQKPDGEIRLSAVPANDQRAKFSLNTNVDMHICDVEGIATAIADTPQRNVIAIVA